eukprot:403355659
MFLKQKSKTFIHEDQKGNDSDDQSSADEQLRANKQIPSRNTNQQRKQQQISNEPQFQIINNTSLKNKELDNNYLDQQVSDNDYDYGGNIRNKYQQFQQDPQYQQFKPLQFYYTDEDYVQQVPYQNYNYQSRKFHKNRGKNAGGMNPPGNNDYDSEQNTDEYSSSDDKQFNSKEDKKSSVRFQDEALQKNRSKQVIAQNPNESKSKSHSSNRAREDSGLRHRAGSWFGKFGGSSRRNKNPTVPSTTARKISQEKNLKKTHSSVDPNSKLSLSPSRMTSPKREKVRKAREKIQKRYEQYYNKWRDYDLLTCILAMLGLIVGIINHEYYLYLQDIKKDKVVDDSFLCIPSHTLITNFQQNPLTLMIKSIMLMWNIDESYGFTANIRFTFKCFIIRNPGVTVICSLFSTVFVLAYILRIFEIQYYRAIGQIDFDDYFQSIWLIVITITTVGYGDIVAFSFFGRFMIMITAFWGAFLISLLIVSVGNIFQLTRNQRKAMHHLFLTRKAATSITSAMRFFLAKRRQQQAQEVNFTSFFIMIELQRIQMLEQGNYRQSEIGGGRSRVQSEFAPLFRKKQANVAGGVQTQNPNEVWNQDLEEELMLSERIEEQDLMEYKSVMNNRLQEFRDEWNELKHIRIQPEAEQENMIHLIKNEVIDLADRFDDMQGIMLKQNEMMEQLMMQQQMMQQQFLVMQRQTNHTTEYMFQHLERPSRPKTENKIGTVENTENVILEQHELEQNEGDDSYPKLNKQMTRSDASNSMYPRQSQLGVDQESASQSIYYQQRAGGQTQQSFSNQRQIGSFMNINRQNLDPADLSSKISFRRSPFYQRERSKYHKLSKTNLLIPSNNSALAQSISPNRANIGMEMVITEESPQIRLASKDSRGSKNEEQEQHKNSQV